MILAAGTWLAAALTSGQQDECQQKVSDWQSDWHIICQICLTDSQTTDPKVVSVQLWSSILRPVSVSSFAPVLLNTHFGKEATGVALSNTQQRHRVYKETSSLYHEALRSIFIVNCTQTCFWYGVLCINYISLHYKAKHWSWRPLPAWRAASTHYITVHYKSANSTTLASISECALPVLGTKASNYITLRLIHPNGRQHLKWMCTWWASMGITSKVSIVHKIGCLLGSA